MSDVLPPPTALRPLDYRVLLDKISSDSLNFESVFSVKGKSVAVVEYRHNLTTSRQGIFDPLAHNGNLDFILERCSEYMSAIEYLQQNSNQLQKYGNRPLTMKTTWTSAMAGPGMFGKPYRFKLNGNFTEELAMVLLKWTGVQWSKGLDLMLSITAIETGQAKPDGVTGVSEDPQALTTQCLEIFRRAAGGAAYLSDTLLPKAQQELEAEGKKLPEVPEMQPWFVNVLEKALLGIAQHLFAHHTQRKVSPPNLSASLFLGASDLFEGCSKAIHNADTQGLKPAPGEFKQFIALYSTMSIARARFCLVQVQLDAREAGRASLLAKHAENELAQCAYVAEGHKAWTEAFNALLADAEALWKHCERVRWNVYSQNLPSDAPTDLPEGRLAASPMEFVFPSKDFELDFEEV